MMGSQNRTFVQIFWAVFRTELRQGWRSPIWWLLVLNFALSVWIALPDLQNPWQNTFTRVFSLMGSFFWFLFLAPWVLIELVERERRRWKYDFFWIHVRHVGALFVAKVVAALVLILTAMLPLIAGSLGLALWDLGWWGVQIWATLMFSLFPLLLFYLVLGMVATWGVPHPFGARVASLGLTLIFIFLQEYASLFDLWGPNPIPYFSPITGFHPLRRVLLWHRCFWAIFTVGLILLTIGRFGRQVMRPLAEFERNWFQQSQRWGMVLLFLAAGPALLFVHEKSRRFYEINNKSMVPVPQTEPLSCPQAYQVHLNLDIRGTFIQGKAYWQGKGGIDLSLPPGLHGQSKSQEDERRSLYYQGIPRWPRQIIWCPECLRDANWIIQRNLSPYPLGWYLVENHSFFVAEGFWHPFPGCPMETLEIHTQHLPHESTIVLEGYPITQQTEKGWIYRWEAPPSHGPLLAVIPYPRVWRQGHIQIVLPGPFAPYRVQDEIITPFWKIIRMMEKADLLNEHQDRTFVVVDQIVYPRWGTSVTFLPIGMLKQRALLDAATYERSVALMMLIGWWCQGAEDCVNSFAQNLLYWKKARISAVTMGDPDQIARQIMAQEEIPLERTRMLPNLLLYGAFRLVRPEVEETFGSEVVFEGTEVVELIDLQSQSTLLHWLDTLYRQNPTRFWLILRKYRDVFRVQDITFGEFVNWMER